MKWTFYQIWNKSLEDRQQKDPKPRDTIWATEIGGAFVDRYLKMKGEKPTNPPNARSLRKFEAGNIWECIIKYVLSRAGILISAQEWLKFEYPDLLPVTGKLDFVAGGNPDYQKAVKLVHSEFDWLPKSISKATLNIITSLREKFPDGLDPVILEIKSCSSFMFEKYERTKQASQHHRFQTFHYLKATGQPEGHIVYISKDDARMIEIGVYNPSETENEYYSDIQAMTHFIRTGKQPPLEKPIVFDPDFLKFSANWKIAYSNYLTKLYGFENQMQFDNKYKPIVERWNRVLGRISEGKNMTKNNEEALGEIKKEGFDVDVITHLLAKEVKDGEHDGQVQ